MKKTMKTALSLIIAAAFLLLMASCSFTEVFQKLFVGSTDDGTADFDMGVIELGAYEQFFRNEIHASRWMGIL